MLRHNPRESFFHPSRSCGNHASTQVLLIFLAVDKYTVIKVSDVPWQTDLTIQKPVENAPNRTDQTALGAETIFPRCSGQNCSNTGNFAYLHVFSAQRLYNGIDYYATLMDQGVPLNVLDKLTDINVWQPNPIYRR